MSPNKSKTLCVTCVLCGHSEEHSAPRNAAPMVTLLMDTLRPKGWTYTVDIIAMTTGDYRPLCPTCSEGV